jgi:hypothetical protein
MKELWTGERVVVERNIVEDGGDLVKWMYYCKEDDVEDGGDLVKWMDYCKEGGCWGWCPFSLSKYQHTYH